MTVPTEDPKILIKQAAPGHEVEANVYADVYRLLMAGMILSSIFFAVGLVLALLHPRHFPLSAEWVRQQYHWGVVFHGLASGNPSSYMMVATVLLILTPVFRVIVSIYAFFADGDHRYVAVTSTVLLVIILTVVLGLLGLR